MLEAERHPWRVHWLVAVVAAVAVLAPGVAHGLDTDPPVIQHVPLTEVDAGPVEIDFTISDQSALFGVLFHWRYAGEADYKQISFPPNETTFSVKLNVDRDFEFWIEAYDEFGNGPALDGNANMPNRVRVRQDGASAPLPPPPPAPQPAPKSEQLTVETPPPPPAPPPPPETPAKPWVWPIKRGSFVTNHIGRLIEARNLPQGRFELNVDAGIATGNNFIEPATSLVGEQGTLGLQYALADYLGFYATSLFSHSTLSSTSKTTSTTAGYPMNGSIIDDFTIGMHLATRHIGLFDLGLLGNLEFPGRVSNPAGPTRYVVSPQILGLATMTYQMLRMHLNVGYKWDNSATGTNPEVNGYERGSRDLPAFETYSLALSNFDDFSVGIAAEVPFNNFDPYIAYSADIPVDRLHFGTCTPSGGKTCGPAPAAFPASSSEVPQRLALGLRYALSQVMAVDGGFEASLTKLPLAGVVIPPTLLIRFGFIWQFGDVIPPFMPSAEVWPPPQKRKPIRKLPKPVVKPAPPRIEAPVVGPPPAIPPIPPPEVPKPSPAALQFENPPPATPATARKPAPPAALPNPAKPAVKPVEATPPGSLDSIAPNSPSLDDIPPPPSEGTATLAPQPLGATLPPAPVTRPARKPAAEPDKTPKQKAKKRKHPVPATSPAPEMLPATGPTPTGSPASPPGGTVTP